MAAGRRRSIEAGYLLMQALLRPWLKVWFRWHFEGAEHIPASGPAIVAVNHISYFDPLAIGYALDSHRRHPRFLAKSELFEVPVVGAILRSARQIKVDRGGRFALRSLRYAEEALAEGELVVVFPEGTSSTAPDLAPSRPKTGVARLALASRLPVIPAALWGGQWFWTKHLGVKPGPGKDIWVRIGAPVSFEFFQDRAGDPQAWREISEAIMGEIAVLLAGLKAAKPWTPRDATGRHAGRFSPSATERKPRLAGTPAVIGSSPPDADQSEGTGSPVSGAGPEESSSGD